jgi:hypothetical protein
MPSVAQRLSSAPAAQGPGHPLESSSDWDGEEETGPWCVDHGAAIRVMSTRDIYDAVAEGHLTPDTKVWRDGRACWLPIAECYELTVRPSAVAVGVPHGPRAAEPGEGTTLMLTTSFAIGVLIGALVYLPFAW